MAESGPPNKSATQTQDSAGATVVTVVEENDEQDTSEQEVPTLTLRLRKPRTDRKVKWSNETVDNEHMNKKKSKCCCIYQKPRKFGESSSSSEDSDDECEHCKGHIEKKKHGKASPTTETPKDDVPQPSDPGPAETT